MRLGSKCGSNWGCYCFLLEKKIVKCFVQYPVFAPLPICWKSVSPAMWFGSNGTSHAISTQSYIYHIHRNMEMPVGPKLKKNGTAVKAVCQGNLSACHFGHAYHRFASPALHFWLWPASWSSGQSIWLLIMRYRVRFPTLPWEFSLKGRIPAVTMIWVGWENLGLRALLALHPPISPLTSSGQRNCASWASQPQKSVTLLPCPGGRTTKSTWTCGGSGPKKILAL